MTNEEKLQVLQRLRDVAKAVSVAGKIPTEYFSPIVISIICEMELYPIAWIESLEKEIKEIEDG